MKTFKIILSAILIFAIQTTNILNAQSIKRIEIESDEYKSIPEIVPVGKKGVLVFNDSGEKVKGENQFYWTFTLYDSEFEKSWNKKVAIKKGLSLTKFNSNEDFLYLLFTENAAKPQFQLLEIDIENGSFTEIITEAPFNVNFTGLETIQDRTFFSGYTYPSAGQLKTKFYLSMCACYIPLLIPGYLVPPAKPILYEANFTKKRSKIIPIHYEGSASVLNLSAGTNSLYALIQSGKRNENVKTHLEEYNTMGKRISSVLVKNKPGYVIIDADVSIIDDDTKVMLGVYTKVSAGKKKKSSSRVGSGIAEGMYFTTFENEKQNEIKYYEFKSFESFWSSIKSKMGTLGAAKVKKKITKKKAKGKEVSIGYQLLLHKTLNKGDQLITIAEAYYPEYHTEYYTTYVNGRATTSSRRVFDGYRYTHAIIAGFDKEGNKIWDQSFGIGDILDKNLRERVKIMVRGDDIVMAYSNGGYITSKILRGQEIVEGEKSVKIENDSNSDDVKSNYESNIVYWYDNYFLSSGVQRIKNKNKKGSDRKKTVFYFNKIEFE